MLGPTEIAQAVHSTIRPARAPSGRCLDDELAASRATATVWPPARDRPQPRAASSAPARSSCPHPATEPRPCAARSAPCSSIPSGHVPASPVRRWALQRRRDSIRTRGRTRPRSTVALALLDGADAVVARDRAIEDLVRVAARALPIVVRKGRPQARRSLDVAQEERDGSRRQLKPRPVSCPGIGWRITPHHRPIDRSHGPNVTPSRPGIHLPDGICACLGRTITAHPLAIPPRRSIPLAEDTVDGRLGPAKSAVCQM